MSQESDDESSTFGFGSRKKPRPSHDDDDDSVEILSVVPQPVTDMALDLIEPNAPPASVARRRVDGIATFAAFHDLPPVQSVAPAISPTRDVDDWVVPAKIQSTKLNGRIAVDERVAALLNEAAHLSEIDKNDVESLVHRSKCRDPMPPAIAAAVNALADAELKATTARFHRSPHISQCHAGDVLGIAHIDTWPPVSCIGRDGMAGMCTDVTLDGKLYTTLSATAVHTAQVVLPIVAGAVEEKPSCVIVGPQPAFDALSRLVLDADAVVNDAGDRSAWKDPRPSQAAWARGPTHVMAIARAIAPHTAVILVSGQVLAAGVRSLLIAQGALVREETDELLAMACTHYASDVMFGQYRTELQERKCAFGLQNGGVLLARLGGHLVRFVLAHQGSMASYDTAVGAEQLARAATVVLSRMLAFLVAAPPPCTGTIDVVTHLFATSARNHRALEMLDACADESRADSQDEDASVD
jgi:hypothetical protein